MITDDSLTPAGEISIPLDYAFEKVRKENSLIGIVGTCVLYVLIVIGIVAYNKSVSGVMVKSILIKPFLIITVFASLPIYLSSRVVISSRKLQSFFRNKAIPPLKLNAREMTLPILMLFPFDRMLQHMLKYQMSSITVSWRDIESSSMEGIQITYNPYHQFFISNLPLGIKSIKIRNDLLNKKDAEIFTGFVKTQFRNRGWE